MLIRGVLLSSISSSLSGPPSKQSIMPQMAEMPVGAVPTESHKKRRRDADDHPGPASHSDRIPQPPPPQSGNVTPINYLSRANANKLQLFQSENEAFSDILLLISDYEGVLSRHESLAANLGAKLTAPRLLRAMESLFEGSIVVSPQISFRESGTSTWYTPSWLEVASFAASNPTEFNLTTTPDGRRVCQFNMKNVTVEIGEDDWRLIMSGALDRFRLVPPQPLEEDEVAELATLDILEKRLQTLIKDADEVARKARQLNYHLSGRKAAINSRRSPPRNLAVPGYPPLNKSLAAPSGGLNPAYDLHSDLLQQFLVPAHQQTVSATQQPPLITGGPTVTDLPRPPNLSSGVATSQAHILTPNSRRSPAYSANSPVHRENTAPTLTAEEPHMPHRSLVQAQVERVPRGGRIIPPCDRCRRLKAWCVKHLTSCQGCTRKHTKCSWKSVTDDEIDLLKSELGHNPTPTPVSNDNPCQPGQPPGATVPSAGESRMNRDETDIDTDPEIPDAKGKETPPSSSSSSRGQHPENATTNRTQTLPSLDVPVQVSK